MKEITGRDNQIICQALKIAIPIMLKYTMSWSNTIDMLRILEAKGHNAPLSFLDESVISFLEEIIKDIKCENTLAHKKNSDNMKDITEMYFSKFSEEKVTKYNKDKGKLLEFHTRDIDKNSHHMKELNKFVKQLRQEFSDGYVPNFDPNDGGSNAKILFLFEKPGPMTDERSGGSGFVSQNNDDETARSTKMFLEEAHAKAGTNRTDIILWNAIPVWNGAIKINKSERLQNTEQTLIRLLKILKKLETIVIVGKEAERLASKIDLTNYQLFSSMHPSPLNRASRRKKWEQIPIVWFQALSSIKK